MCFDADSRADAALDRIRRTVDNAPTNVEALVTRFYPMFRIYYPKAGLFDGTWKLPDVELVK